MSIVEGLERRACYETSDIGSSTVWTLEASPYRVAFDSDGIQVADGATLAVEPGVEVQFEPYASLIVLGTLKAIGTERRTSDRLRHVCRSRAASV